MPGKMRQTVRTSQGQLGTSLKMSADIYGHLDTFPCKTGPSQDSAGRVKLANENLRAALERAGLAADDLAQIVQVDIRTVRRWLSGGTPYPRQRAKVARALDSTEHDLWPEIATAASRPPSPRSGESSDLLAGYPSASDPDAPDLQALMRDATDRIELLGDTLIPTLATPGMPELLATKASRGCAVRILIYDTHAHLGPLLDAAGIEIRLLEMPADYTIHRFDDELLLTLHAVSADPDRGPLIHLRRVAPAGMFDRLADYYDHLWEQTPEPLRPHPDHPPEDDEDEDPQTDARLPLGEPPAAGHSDRSARSPRRWPRRPDGPRDHG
jgi:transcriptional regulator with XRE-family HTH domain